MANYDKAMADRVWKRVQGAPEDQHREPNLQGLILNEYMAACAYQRLARQLGQKEAAVLQRMAREEQSHAACLKGMHMLMKGKPPAVRMPHCEKEPVDALLRKCYAGELRSIAAYDALASHAEYGYVFAAMANREREHSRYVLELLGDLQQA